MAASSDIGASPPTPNERASAAPLRAASSNTVRFRNHLALGLLIVGKAIGIGGLVVSSAGSRLIGGLMLGLYGILIVAAVVMCIVMMRDRKREEVGHKAVLAQMVREGTLKQYLRDLQAEELEQEVKTADAPSP